MSTRSTLALLQRFESRNVTCIEPDGSWPTVWKRARDARVWDAEGRVYIDLTAAFGVAAAGHANRAVVRAAKQQMDELLHAMGDVHPHDRKAQLARELSRLTFGRWSASHDARTRGPRPATHGKTLFCNSGFEAVEAALKTAHLATRKRGVIAFEGGYHGLGYGALNATHRELFRRPFLGQLGRFGWFAPYPRNECSLAEVEESIRRLCRQRPVGAILVEPIQARGGIRLPPPGFLPLLRRLCDEAGAVLIADEIYTGFGRTGRWFACEHTATQPDLICLGKALTGGFPLSACVGRAELMDAAWPASTGEAIHTSTFLGHPVGCAMALAQIGEIRRQRLVGRSAALGRRLLAWLSALGPRRGALRLQARGLGLMAGLELCLGGGAPATAPSLHAIKEMLHRGFVLLPEGEHANVIAFTPPLTIPETALRAAVAALGEVLS